jgi:hypothetical protein
VIEKLLSKNTSCFKQTGGESAARLLSKSRRMPNL